ncbi:hypothetical protein MRB53_042068 [Persea americana]|nr:hypothetical protein MRB53_042068 [Persea americana]
MEIGSLNSLPPRGRIPTIGNSESAIIRVPAGEHAHQLLSHPLEHFEHGLQPGNGNMAMPVHNTSVGGYTGAPIASHTMTSARAAPDYSPSLGPFPMTTNIPSASSSFVPPPQMSYANPWTTSGTASSMPTTLLGPNYTSPVAGAPFYPHTSSTTAIPSPAHDLSYASSLPTQQIYTDILPATSEAGMYPMLQPAHGPSDRWPMSAAPAEYFYPPASQGPAGAGGRYAAYPPNVHTSQTGRSDHSRM